MNWKITLKKKVAVAYLRVKFYNIIPFRGTERQLIFQIGGGYHKQHPGLVDRLKAIVGMAYIAQKNDYAFKLLFTDPVDLRIYLRPNIIDWNCDEQDIAHSFSGTRLIEYVPYAPIPKLDKTVKQYHCYVYTGQDTIEINKVNNYQQVWHELFQGLFRPTSYLQKLVNEATPSNSYVVAHFRFVNSLGSFEHTQGFEPLPEAEQKTLIEQCLAQIEEIKKDNAQLQVIVLSDSKKFLTEVVRRGYSTLSGMEHIEHLAFGSAQQAAYDKTFVDFYAMIGAERVYSVHGKDLYNSQFPYYAALAGKQQFYIRNLDGTKNEEPK